MHRAGMLAMLEQENTRLRQWKKSAMAMMPNWQEIGSALDLPLGSDVPKCLASEIMRIAAIRQAAIELRNAKGRHNTEQAAAKLFSLLPKRQNSRRTLGEHS